MKLNELLRFLVSFPDNLISTVDRQQSRYYYKENTKGEINFLYINVRSVKKLCIPPGNQKKICLSGRKRCNNKIGWFESLCSLLLNPTINYHKG